MSTPIEPEGMPGQPEGSEAEAGGSAGPAGVETEPLYVVLCTCANRDSTRIAHALVEDGVAACVNVLPKITSIYRWDGRICEDRETLLVIKTVASHLEALRAAIVSLHSYQVPEILVLPVRAEESHDAYVKWVRSTLVGP